LAQPTYGEGPQAQADSLEENTLPAFSHLQCQPFYASSRLSASKDGFREVRVDKEPSKKRRAIPVVIDEATSQAGPVPLSILQGWGVKCGVAPGELTEDALLQAPNPNVDNDST